MSAASLGPEELGHSHGHHVVVDPLLHVLWHVVLALSLQALVQLAPVLEVHGPNGHAAASP